MKQKIIIKVDAHCDKCRTMALTIAAKEDGVISVALEGPGKDKVVVIGEDVDAAKLAICLGKKLNHASLELVEEVKPKKPEEKPKPPEPLCACCRSIYCARPNCCTSPPPWPQPMCTVVPCENSGPNCTIM